MAATEYLTHHKLEDKKHLLCIAAPALIFSRSQYFDSDEIKNTLQKLLFHFTNLHITIFHADENVTQHLQAACAKLQDNSVYSVVFVGLGSLLNIEVFLAGIARF
ncbi:hypothetical protein MNBD_GAMMA22-1180 [hydrothermal vent metagenome]|uniref:Uncharacterized protein n=1 Tax=hydrothermal vent metagenome TaxID=652676 RepID=A0A3B0ZX58_9ZZZZ